MTLDTTTDWQPDMAQQGLSLWSVEVEHAQDDGSDLECVRYSESQPSVTVKWDPAFPLFPGTRPPGSLPRWRGQVIASTPQEAIRQVEDDVRLVLNRWRASNCG